MSNLENRAQIPKRRLNIGLSPSDLLESNTPTAQEKLIIVKSDFIAKKLRELKAPENILSYANYKKSSGEISEESKSKKIIDLERIKNEVTYNPSKIVKKLDAVNAFLMRRRRVSRCRTKGPHAHGECGSPYCRVQKTSEELKRIVDRSKTDNPANKKNKLTKQAA